MGRLRQTEGYGKVGADTAHVTFAKVAVHTQGKVNGNYSGTAFVYAAGEGAEAVGKLTRVARAEYSIDYNISSTQKLLGGRAAQYGNILPLTFREVVLPCLAALTAVEKVIHCDLVAWAKGEGCGIAVAAVVAFACEDKDPSARGECAYRFGYRLACSAHKGTGGDAQGALCVGVYFIYVTGGCDKHRFLPF